MTTEEIPIYFRWIEYVGPFKPLFSEILVLQLEASFSFSCSWTFFEKSNGMYVHGTKNDKVFQDDGGNLEDSHIGVSLDIEVH